MKYSVVIPNYNGKEILEQCLPSIVEACSDAEIIIVDDASTDNSVSYITENFPLIVCIKNKKNRGFSFSANRGVRSSSSEIVFLLNSDIVVEKDFADTVIPLFDDESVFAVQSKVYSFDGSSVEVGCAEPVISKGYFSVYQNTDTQNVCYSFFAGGGMSAFRKSYYCILGGMNRLYYPFYWEDIDLSYRAWKHGFKVLYQPNSKIYHMGSATIDNTLKRQKKEIIIYGHRIVFVLASFQWARAFYFLFLHCIRFIAALFTQNTVIKKGTMLAFKKWEHIIRERVFFAQVRTCSDQHIFNMIGKTYEQ